MDGTASLVFDVDFESSFGETYSMSQTWSSDVKYSDWERESVQASFSLEHNNLIKTPSFINV